MKKEKLEQKLEIAKQHAQKQGGNCLSNEYVNNSSLMLWSCGNHEHKEWTATYKKVVCCGTWCPRCSKEIASIKMQSPKLTAEQRLVIAHNHAKEKGGVCLTNEPRKQKQPLTWKCENEQHQTWTALHDSVVKLNSWCPECGITQRADSRTNKEALKIAKEHAQSKGGECLSNEYVSARDYLTWKCSNPEHTTWLSWYDTVIRQGHWCPQCANETNISESRVRTIFEVSFGQKFPNTKPEWNMNPWTNKPLELDGYCKEFNIAFEYDGEHHFEIDPYNTNRKMNGLIYQKFKDEQKRKNCRSKGITLINIPCIPNGNLNNQKHVLQYVIEICMKYGLTLTFTEQQLEKIKEKF
ncbi:hypothetical protein [Serratia marcescens]|uniref:hypothetical protein n=1 Tax=Serratia marcescens TaxID=615 RepID=UPI001F152175|nr:hypothetical protein [Serratia marcescens]